MEFFLKLSFPIVVDKFLESLICKGNSSCAQNQHFTSLADKCPLKELWQAMFFIRTVVQKPQ